MNDSATQSFREGQERLARDLKAVVNDAEDLLRHAVRETGQGYDEARTRLEQSLVSARAQLASVEQAVLDGVYEAGRATDRYVRQHSWESIGVGAAIGLLIGLLIARR